MESFKQEHLARSIEHGAELFASNCAPCHGPQGQGVQAVNAPPLVGQADWYLLSQLHKFKSGRRGGDPADVSGQTMRPNTLALDDQAMLNVVAYIQTLQ